MKHISQKTQDLIEKRIKNDIENNRFYGASAAVRQGSEEIRVTVGLMDGETNTPLRENTLFRIASMSKLITAVAVMREYEKGRLSPDDELCKYLPAYASMKIGRLTPDGRVEKVGPASHRITIEHLLNHRSGVISGDTAVQYNAIPSEDRASLEKIVGYYPATMLAFDPGTDCMYSGVAAFDILSRLVEMTSGMDYETYLRKEILDPLGMTDTTFLPTPEQFSRLCPLHTLTPDGKSATEHVIPHIFEDIPATCFSGGAGLCSSLPDYLRFARMLLGNGTLDGVRILKSETVERMVTVPYEIPNAQHSEVFGLGMRVIIGRNRLPLRSFGWSGAYGTHFFIDRENDLCAVYMKNARNGGGAGAETANHFEEDVENSLE